MIVYKEDIERVKKFFNRENVYKQLKATVSFLIPHRSDVKLILNIGGDSFTDGNTITVGLPEIFIKSSYEEIFTALRALTGHECQHINSSNFDAYRRYQEELVDYFLKKYSKFPSYSFRNYILKIAKAFGNGTEDGRIEKILGSRFPGYVKYLKFLNGAIWKCYPVRGVSELEDFLTSVVRFAATGLNPKDFSKFYKGSNLEKNLNKIKPLILRGIDAPTCQRCFDICKEMIWEVEDYLISLLENLTNEDEEFLANMSTNPEFTTSEEREYNTNPSVSIHFKPPKEEQNQEKPSNEQSSEKDNNDEKGQEKDSSGKGHSEESLKEEKKENANSSTGSKENNEKESEEFDEKQINDGAGNEKSNGEEENEEKSNNDEEDSQQEISDSSSSNNQSDDMKQENLLSEENEDSSIEEAISEELKELIKEVAKEVKEKIEEKSKKKGKKEKNEEEYKLTDEDMLELENQYKNDCYNRFVEKRGLPLCRQLPVELKREGARFRKEIERILRNKEAYTLRGQRKGILDVNSLYKLQAKDFHVFMKKGAPVQSDYVFYLLEDGSGSMLDYDKDIQSKHALSIMEEGLKGIVPFKIATFTVEWWTENAVVHHVVKDFNENNTHYNYSFNALKYRRAEGGNKDGYSIRVATKELLKRPEKDKVLIILSDGLPEDYKGGMRRGIVDVKQAVKEARKAGILVVAIMFGTEEFRNANMEVYRYMYEKNIISCDPSNITNQLIRMLKKVLAR